MIGSMAFNYPLLRERRESLKLSQAQAADRAGFSVAHYADLERGRYPAPTLPTLEKLAEAVGCKAADLISNRPIKAPPPAKRGRAATVDWEKWDRLLGTMPDVAVARRIGCSPSLVLSRRRRLGIEVFRAGKSKKPATGKARRR